VINVLDVVMKSPHFKEQLKSVSYLIDLVENNLSTKAKISAMIVDEDPNI